MRCKNCGATYRKPNDSMKRTGFCKTCLPNIIDFMNGKIEALEKLEADRVKLQNTMFTLSGEVNKNVKNSVKSFCENPVNNN